jgi:hypothetical protein
MGCFCRVCWKAVGVSCTSFMCPSCTWHMQFFLKREREFLLINVEHFTYECENFHSFTVVTSWYVAFCSTKITLAHLQTVFYYSVVNSLVSIVNRFVDECWYCSVKNPMFLCYQVWSTPILLLMGVRNMALRGCAWIVLAAMTMICVHTATCLTNMT